VEIEVFIRDADTELPTSTLEAAVTAELAHLSEKGDDVTVVFTWWHGGRDIEEGSQRHCTFVSADGAFTVVDRLAGFHPAVADRLELWRLGDFEISAMKAPDGIHLISAVAKENRQDERLIAFLEVFDLDVEKNSAGVSRYAHLTSQLSQAAIAIRRARAALPDPSSSLSNRIVVVAEPTWTLTDSDLQAVIQELLPLTRGLGLEKVIGRGRMTDPVTGTHVEGVIHITTPPTVGVMIGRTKPSPNRIRPMSEYRRRVVAMQRRGLVYPYEIVELLVGTGATHTELPSGHFVEYDFVGEGFEAVSRPRGANTARIVVGLIESRAAGFSDTITRVLILNEPSRDLASLAEPECRRIVAALDLAAELGVPVEWYAVSSGARIAMDSGTENLDWTAKVLRRIIEFTQADGEINVVVVGVNVGAQSYFDAEATMLMHTSGVLIMVGRSAMVLTGKQALEFSGGVAAEDNAGIGGYERIAGPNGQAQFWVPDVESACALLFRHYASSLPYGAWRETSDPTDRDISPCPHQNDGNGLPFAQVGDIFSPVHNPDRKQPFDIRSVLSAVRDQDAPPLERWTSWQDAENVVAWDTRLGGFAVSLIGIESQNLRRRLPRPVAGPDSWTAGTLFPQSSKKLARVINGASGRRPLVILANLSGFDGSPESMRKLQLEYGAEIGRAIVNFRGPIVFSVISRYHGGAYVVFSKSLNPNMEVSAVEGSRASVIGGAPAAAVVFTREVRARVRQDGAVAELESRVAEASADEQPVLQHQLHQLTGRITTEIQVAVAREFDDIHTVERALHVGSIDHIVAAADLRPYLIAAVRRGLDKTKPDSTFSDFTLTDFTLTDSTLTEGIRHA
jgi:acetyl-CoA carboxylase carboxyltransferase component